MSVLVFLGGEALKQRVNEFQRESIWKFADVFGEGAEEGLG